MSKEHFKLYLGIAVWVFLFILFFQPFTVEKFEFENRLLFIAGFGLIFLILPLILLPISWFRVVSGFIIMHLTSGIILSSIFQTAHVVPTSSYPLPSDNSVMTNNWAVHQLYTTSDFSPNSKIFSWFIGGLNYQVVHHLFPNISHIHYKNLAPIVQSTAQKYGLPYHVNRNFLTAVSAHIKMLKLLGDRSYENEPASGPLSLNSSIAV